MNNEFDWLNYDLTQKEETQKAPSFDWLNYDLSPEWKELKIEKPSWASKLLFGDIWHPPELPKKKQSPLEMLKPKWWSTGGRNLWEWSKDILKSAPQLAQAIQEFTPQGIANKLAQQATEATIPIAQTIQQSAPSGSGMVAGRVWEATEDIIPKELRLGETSADVKGLGKLAWELVTWSLKYLKDFYEDPVGTVQKRPGDTLMMLIPSALKFFKAKISAGNLLTKKDLTSAFRETFKEQAWKIKPEDINKATLAEYNSKLYDMAKTSARKPGEIKTWAEEMPIIEQEIGLERPPIKITPGKPPITKGSGVKGLSVEDVNARRDLEWDIKVLSELDRAGVLIPEKKDALKKLRGIYGERYGEEPAVPEIEYMPPTGAMEHAGEAVSAEAIQRPLEFYIWDSKTKNLRTIDKFTGVDYQPGPHEAVFQKNTITNKVQLRDKGEAASLPSEKTLEKSMFEATGRKAGELKGLTVKMLSKEEADEINFLIGAKNKIAQKTGIDPEALPPVKNIPDIPPETPPPAQKFIDVSKTLEKSIYAISQAKTIRGAQKVLYEAELGKRAAAGEKMLEKLPGESGFRAALAEHAGELPKIAYKGIGEQFTQDDLGGLAGLIKSAPLDYWEKLSAYRGFRKVFSKEYGVVPQPEELLNLEKAFGSEFVKSLLGKGGGQLAKTVSEVLNVPRTLMTTADFSFGFRQGIFFVGKKSFWESCVKQFGYFGSEKEFNGLLQSIVDHPDYRLLKNSPVARTMPEATSLAMREEPMMGAPIAEKIPVAGEVVKASNRAYTGFALKLRTDSFYDLVDKSRKIWKLREPEWLKEVDAASVANNSGLIEKLRLERAKIDPDTSQYLINKIGDFINSATGRGKLPAAIEKSAPLLNAAFFSPRLMFSRLNLLNPVYYAKLPPVVRKEALKSLFTFLGAGSTMLGLAKVSGAEVGVNPFSADFGKIKIGNTRIDVWGGFQQYIRTTAQFAWGKTVSATTEKERHAGEGYPPLTRAEIAGRFIEYKQAPVLSFAMALMKGRDIMGRPLNVPKELLQRVTPMVVQDAIDLYRDDPTLFPVSFLGIFGVGLQTYERKKPKYKRLKWE